MTEEIDELKAAMADLQSQMAFQEDTVQALNDALADQQQEILVLRRQVELLRAQLEEQASATDATAARAAEDEKPPHY